MVREFLTKDELVMMMRMNEHCLRILSPMVPGECKTYYEEVLVSFEMNISRIEGYFKIKEDLEHESSSQRGGGQSGNGSGKEFRLGEGERGSDRGHPDTDDKQKD